jgi:hypothetical protein
MCTGLNLLLFQAEAVTGTMHTVAVYSHFVLQLQYALFRVMIFITNSYKAQLFLFLCIGFNAGPDNFSKGFSSVKGS